MTTSLCSATRVSIRSSSSTPSQSSPSAVLAPSSATSLSAHANYLNESPKSVKIAYNDDHNDSHYINIKFGIKKIRETPNRKEGLKSIIDGIRSNPHNKELVPHFVAKLQELNIPDLKCTVFIREIFYYADMDTHSINLILRDLNYYDYNSTSEETEQLFIAVQNKDIEAVRLAVGKSKTYGICADFNAKKEDGFTALHFAAITSSAEIIELLLQVMSPEAVHAEASRYTAFQLAWMGPHISLDCITLLIPAVSNTEINKIQFSDEQTFIWGWIYRMEKGGDKFIKFLQLFLLHLSPEHINAQTYDTRETRLHFASVRNDIRIAELVIYKMSIDKIKAENTAGRTALQISESTTKNNPISKLIKSTIKTIEKARKAQQEILHSDKDADFSFLDEYLDKRIYPVLKNIINQYIQIDTLEEAENYLKMRRLL